MMEFATSRSATEPLNPGCIISQQYRPATTKFSSKGNFTPAIEAYLAGNDRGGGTGVDLFCFREEQWGKPNHKPSINHPPLGFMIGIPIRDDFFGPPLLDGC